MATHTKKLKILQKYVDDGFGERIVLLIKDEWSFNPDGYCHILADREFFSVEETLEQFKNKQGIVYDNWSTTADFKDICNAIEKDKPIVRKMFYQDTYDEFHSKYPNYEVDMKKKFNQFMSLYDTVTFNNRELINKVFA